MNCKDCKWWQNENSDWGDVVTSLRADANDAVDYWELKADERKEYDAESAQLARMCKSPKLHFYVMPADGEAAVVDGSEYKGNLVTTPSFGCVNWEATP